MSFSPEPRLADRRWPEPGSGNGKRVLVAMSGGVDSSVTAYLLQRAGYEVLGATIQTWASKDCDKLNTRACCSIEGVEDARSVADRLGIPYYVFNFEKEFKAAVVDYFTSEYLKGRTPNPCIACNQKIKFRLFRKRALAMGIDRIATGHYADVRRGEDGYYYVAEGRDQAKDQSYVLFALSQEELARLVLPLGVYEKGEIRAIARELGLRVSDKPDSQEICFIPSNDYAAFLKRELALEEKHGPVKTKDGRVLGGHRGYFHYTIGQRRGLGIAHREPLYVTAIDAEKNEVIVGTKEEVRGREFEVEGINWMMALNGRREFRFQVKIRSTHRKAEAMVRVEDTGRGASVRFEEAQEAITPGQAAVFYTGERVAGGGWIRSAAA
jgi:tRNA-specific 2-thiouridylase